MARSTFPFSQPPHMAGTREEAVFASEGQKARMETHQVAIVFGDGGGEIVEPDLARDAAHESESVDMTTHEGLKALAVRELQIQLPAVPSTRQKA